jgi:hypothetical protein
LKHHDHSIGHDAVAGIVDGPGNLALVELGEAESTSQQGSQNDPEYVQVLFLKQLLVLPATARQP